MSEAIKPRCCHTSWSGGWGRDEVQCRHNASLEHEGKHYCKLHHPPTAQAKQEAKRAKWSAEVEADRTKRAAERAEAAEQKRRADCYGQLVERVKELEAAAKLVLDWYEAENDHSKADFYQRMQMCRDSEDAIRAALSKSLPNTVAEVK